MVISELIKNLESCIENPHVGLPDEVFYFIGRNTPYINVDLLLITSDGRKLLTWRDDQHTGAGWHIPGGIVRFRETFSQRLIAVASNEIGVSVERHVGPIEINEIISEQVERSHFISLLYIGRPNKNNEEKLIKLVDRQPDVMQLFEKAPNDLLSWHSIYKKYIDKEDFL